MRASGSVVTLLMSLTLVVWCIPGSAEEAIGVVRTLSGQATIERGGKTLLASAGLDLLPGDTLVTGPDGSLGVIFRDNSTLSLGPESSLVIRKFLFSPEEGNFGFLARISRGTMAYLSGLIGKSAPGSARFETPVASIGIRGTRFAVKVGKPVSDKKLHE